MRVALSIEYDGGAYHGWQWQPGLHTLQGVIEQALSQVADNPVEITCAGRTDTGVHATHQVIHFDTQAIRPLRAWVHGTNNFLPKDICVKWAYDMPETFHARYSATARRYRYVILNTAVRPALFRGQVTWNYRMLDHDAMRTASTYLLGENDFTTFRSVECQSKTPMRRIISLNVSRFSNWVVIDITANAFLHHMVRNIAGVLMSVGVGKNPPAWVGEILKAKDRRLGAETAPPYGLYLVDVDYHASFGIKKQPLGPFFLKEN